MPNDLEHLEVAYENLAIIREQELGQTLLQRPRYGHFRPEDIAIPEWIDLFDNDVDNFEHNGLTAYIAHIVAVTEGLSPELHELLVRTASIHDLPEDVSGSEKGDPQFNISNEHDAYKERRRLLELADDEEFPLTREQVLESLAVMEDSKKQPPETEAGAWFNLIERLGYLRTALIAHEASNNPARTEAQRLHITWMYANILGNHLIVLNEATTWSKTALSQITNNVFVLDRMVAKMSHPETLASIKALCGTAGEEGKRLNPHDEIRRIGTAAGYWKNRQFENF